MFPALLRKKWIWITAFFIALNAFGLFKVNSVIKQKNYFSIRLYVPWKQHPIIFYRVTNTPEDYASNKLLQTIQTINPVMVKSVEGKMADTESLIQIELSKEPGPEAIKGYVSLKPEKPFRVERSWHYLNVYADFKPGDEVRVEVLKGLPFEDGSKLEETHSDTVSIEDYEPSIRFKTSGGYLMLEGSQTLPVETVNIEKIKVTVSKVYDNNLVYLLSNMGSYSIPENLGPDAKSKEFEIKLSHNEKGETPIYVKDVLGGEAQGLYFLSAQTSEKDSWESDSKLIIATNLGMVVKRSESDLLVWLNHLGTTQSVSGASIKVFSKTNQQLLEGVTDANGFIHFKDVHWAGDRKAFIVTASTTSDLTFINLEETAIAETDFDVEGRPYLSSGYESFLYGDRDLYRPGETAHFRALVRGMGVTLPGTFPVELEIKRPDNRTLKKLNALLSQNGTAEWELELPADALTGSYKANVVIPGSDHPSGVMTFQVEEFMPARLAVKLKVPEKRYTPGENIQAEVLAQQFFGAAASDKFVELKAILTPTDFAPENYKSYSFKDETVEFSEIKIPVGEKKTGSDGKAIFDFKLPEEIKAPGALSLSVSAAVRETGGRVVTARETRSFDPYPVYIGVRKKAEGYAKMNEPSTFEYVILTPEGKPTQAEELEVRVSEIEWDSVLKKDKDGQFRYVTENHEEVVHSETIKGGNSAGSFNFTPKSWGNHIVRLSIKGKGSHQTALKFSTEVPWGEAMPWAMERPDRVELQLDKKSYLPGETAKLVIKSPFKGKALVTVAQDHVLSFQSVTLESVTQEISLPVEKVFAPNAYISVTVIRPVMKEEKWVAHRAYGVIPVMLNQEEHQLNLSIQLPENSLPNQEIHGELRVERSGKAVSNTEISLALVDEGILQISGFKNPNPFEFFYGKRGHKVETYDFYSFLIPEYGGKKPGADSSPSGDAPGYDPKKHLNPISVKRVQPVALWKSGIHTDSKGLASIDFKIPEFTGKLRLMAVAAGETDFGNGETSVKVSEPLMIEPSIPRFLSTNDAFEMTVSIFNQTGKDGTALVSLEVSEGFKILSAPSQTILAKDKSETLLKFSLQTPATPGKGAMTVKAELETYKTKRTTEISVRPAVPFTTEMGSGMVNASGKTRIQLPSGWLKGTEKLNLIVSGLPSVRFLGALKFLMEYPYGCIEQTTSTVFPLIYLKELLPVLDPKRYSASRIDRYIQNGIERIMSMQTPSGGFGMWPGDWYPHSDGSLYAAEFLVEANKAGYPVPQNAMKDILKYLDDSVSKKSDLSEDWKIQAVYVLAKAGKVKSSWIRRQQEIAEKLSDTGKLYLAGSLALMGDKKAMNDLLGKSISEKSFLENSESEFQPIESAVALSLFMDIDPENAMVPVLVKRIESSMKNGNWGTTQNNAQALLGLGKYARFLKSQEQKFTGRVLNGDKLLASLDDQNGAVLSSPEIAGKDLQIEIEGSGNAYYYWSAGGVRADGKVEEKDHGLKLRRRFLDKDGKPVQSTHFRQGDTSVVEISLDAAQSYQQVVLSDLLPAGFEIENPRLFGEQGVGNKDNGMLDPDKVDIRDDRILVFTNLKSGAENHYQYVVRAVTPGKFQLPPASAECMYDPAIMSVNGGGEVVIDPV